MDEKEDFDCSGNHNSCDCGVLFLSVPDSLRLQFRSFLTSCLTYNKYRCRIAPIKSKGALENDLRGAFLFIHINTFTGIKTCIQREVPSLRCIFCTGKQKGRRCYVFSNRCNLGTGSGNFGVFYAGRICTLRGGADAGKKYR